MGKYQTQSGSPLKCPVCGSENFEYFIEMAAILQPASPTRNYEDLWHRIFSMECKECSFLMFFAAAPHKRK